MNWLGSRAAPGSISTQDWATHDRNQSTFQQLGLSRLKRKPRKDLVLRLESAEPGLSFVHSNAGGIDVGDESHLAAVPAGRDPNPVQEFATWTEDLVRRAKWLLARKIDTVAL